MHHLVRANHNILDLHQTVDQNVLVTRNVPAIKHALMKNVKILAQDLAEQMQNVELWAIHRIACASVHLAETHSHNVYYYQVRESRSASKIILHID